MVYGETGRFPLYVYVYTRMISYWAKLTSGNENKIVHILYKNTYTQYRNGEFKNPWLAFINRILDRCGFSNIWGEQGINTSFIIEFTNKPMGLYFEEIGY